MAKTPPSPRPPGRRGAASPPSEGLTLTRKTTRDTRPAARTHTENAVPAAISITVEPRRPLSPDERRRHEKREADKDFLKTALKRFQLADQAEGDLRRKMHDDKLFHMGEQWPLEIKTTRAEDGRPCMTINRLPQFTRQVRNQISDGRPAVQVRPVDSGADKDTAEVLQGIVRHIETISDADEAYEQANKDQVEMGRGFILIDTVYSQDDDSFAQDIVIKRARNPFAYYVDPSCQKFDYSDARWAFEIEDMSREEFEDRYGDEHVGALRAFESLGNPPPVWLDGKHVRVARYWWVETVSDKLLRTREGRQIRESEVKSNPDAYPENFLEDARRLGLFTNERTIERRLVKWAVINCAEVLEQGDWAGKWIPIVPVLGEEDEIDGKVDLRGMVRDGKEAQFRYDVSVTSEVETLTQAPRAPLVGYKGQFTDPKWKDANRRNYMFLEIDRLDTVTGEPLTLPQPLAFNLPIQPVVIAIQQADSDLRMTMGSFDPFPMERTGSEKSGKAILARQHQLDVGNSHFGRYLARAIRQVGRILIDLIPKIYDEPRVLRILGLDDKERTVMVFAGQPPPDDFIVPEGVEHIYDLGVGRYDVVANMGKSWQTSREERTETLTGLAQAAPQMVPRFADLWVGSMDWTGAQQIADRLVPPDVKQAEQNKGLPPEVAQRITTLQQALQQAIGLLKSKEMELDSRERIANMNNLARIAAAALQSQQQADVALLQAELARLQQLEDQGHQLRQAQTAALEGPPDEPEAPDAAPAGPPAS